MTAPGTAARTAAGTAARANIDALTGLRFVAAFSIVLGHAYRPWLEVTAIGMPLFFTLSGFIIHYVYSEAFGGRWRRAAGEFAIARFSRLYPLYLALLAFLILHEPAGRSFGHLQNIPAFLAYAAACWTWWPILIDGHLAGFFYVSWSVSTEIFFYVCYALVLYRIARIRSVTTCLAALLLFCVLAYAFFFALFVMRDMWEPAVLQGHPALVARTADYNRSFYRWLLYLSPYCRLPEFIGGVLTCQLFLLSRRQRSLLDRVRPAALGLVGIAVMAVLYAQFRYFGEHDPWYAADHFTYGAFIVNLHQNFLFAPCCYALIFSLACGGWALARALSSRPALFCGDVSYSTYLSHEMVLAKLHQLGVDASATVPYLAVLLAIVYVVSWLLYSLVEMPAKGLLRTLLSNRAPRRAAVPASE
ncbi:MAG TPA: acyltransferase [Stellaceae bacterium]|nr:acyltransferase [Stellaceae bacterium]